MRTPIFHSPAGMRLILVRHGDTVANSRDRYIGSTDAALNGDGRDQARRLAVRLRGEGIARVYSSALVRARETAEAIAKSLALDVDVVREFNELDFGEWEGLTRDEIAKLAPEHFAAWRSGDESFRFPGGDCRADFRTRVRGALDRVVTDADGCTIAIVAHVGVVRTAIGDALGLSGPALWSFRVDPASIHVIHFELGGPVVAALNETAHLR
ncbi:MAG: histidine phosphatase family protein [Planctomycetes bacterium]|nr:histidine phosphatase family protein [Planctomycetota bacterium]